MTNGHRKKRRRAGCLLLALTALLQAGGLPIVQARTGADSASEASRRGEDLRRRWDIEGAEAAFRKAATLDPANLEAALGLARIARARLEYPRALSLLDKVAREHPDSSAVPNEYGSIYLAAEEPDRARRFFERALRISSSDVAALIGMAEVSLLERDYQDAVQRLRSCLERETGNSAARSMLARALLEMNRVAEAEEEARRAIALDSYNVEALYLLAYIKSTERDADESRSLARRAVSLDPFHFSARRMLSQYLDGRAGYEQRASERARMHYGRARTYKEQAHLTMAIEELEAALRIEPRYYRALIALADAWLREGEYQRAAATAKLAIAVDPDGSIAHFELSCAHRGINERARIEIGAADFGAWFYERPLPAAYATTREIFPNYSLLTRRQQAVIDAAVGPLALYLPRLANRRARHYLLSFDEGPGDLPGFSDVVGRKTFDGRYYGSIRGIGGLVTVSGIEYLDQAALGGFNTIAHEFAHQVHLAVLSKREVTEIRRLYERAKREGRYLDHYSAANEDEYFAQGYEAFISDRKRPAAGVTGRHTRQELLARDPELYKFLVKLTGKPQPSKGAQPL